MTDKPVSDALVEIRNRQAARYGLYPADSGVPAIGEGDWPIDQAFNDVSTLLADNDRLRALAGRMEQVIRNGHEDGCNYWARGCLENTGPTHCNCIKAELEAEALK